MDGRKAENSQVSLGLLQNVEALKWHWNDLNFMKVMSKKGFFLRNRLKLHKFGSLFQSEALIRSVAHFNTLKN